MNMKCMIFIHGDSNPTNTTSIDTRYESLQVNPYLVITITKSIQAAFVVTFSLDNHTKPLQANFVDAALFGYCY